MKNDKEIIKTTLSCNSLNMLEYYELYIKKCKYFERSTIAELLYMAEWSQRNNLKRADKTLQNTKRKIIFSTRSGIFWNSYVVHFYQFLNGIKEIYNMDLFMDTLLEIKRVHASTATDLAQNFIRLIRDFYLFEIDRNLIANLQYDVMMAGSSEKANIRDAMAKFNIKNDRHYEVDLEIFCENNITNNLYKLANKSSNDRNLITLSSKIEYIENIFEFLDMVDEELNKLNYVASTIVFDDYYKMHQ